MLAADDPIKVGAIVFEYHRPALLGVVEEVELEERWANAGSVKYARVRWLNGDHGRVSRNAPAGQNWSVPTFLRVADPMTALAALAAEGRTTV